MTLKVLIFFIKTAKVLKLESEINTKIIRKTKPRMASAMNSVSKLSVGEAIDEMGLGKFQYRVMFLVSLFWAADAMEVLLLSVLKPVLICVWDISSLQVALLTTAVFLGMTIGSPTFGLLGAKFGRKIIAIQGSGFLALYGLFSAVSPNYKWLVILRFMVGFFMGTLPQCVTINTEMMPGGYRIKAFLVMSFAWTAGSCISILLAMATLSYDTWGIFVALCAVPPLLFLILQYFWLPESPHYLQSKGRIDEAKAIIDDVAYINQTPLGTWKLKTNEEMENDTSDKDVKQIKQASEDAINDIVSTSENDKKGLVEKPNNQKSLDEEQGHLAQLLSKDWRRTTLILWFLMFYCAFGYYGVILISPSIISQELCSSHSGSSNSTSSTCSITRCHEVSASQFGELLWTTAAEVPGLLLLIFLCDYFGRIKMMVVGFLIVAATSLGAGVCAIGHILQVLFLFLGRGAAFGVFSIATLYITEVYPTHLRSSGTGFCYFWARVGGMTTPYISQVLSKSSTMTSQSVYCAVGVLAAVAAALLQVETTGRRIK